MPENVEAVNVYNAIVPFLGEGLELPGCLPWIFETEDVADEKATLEKVKIIHGIMRSREIEKMSNG